MKQLLKNNPNLYPAILTHVVLVDTGGTAGSNLLANVLQ